MPNDLSNEFHTIEDAIVAFFEKELQNAQNGAATIIADAETVVKNELPKVEPIILAAAEAGVQAVLTMGTGGGTLAALASAGLAAAVKAGGPALDALGEDALSQLETLVGIKSMAAMATPAAG